MHLHTCDVPDGPIPYNHPCLAWEQERLPVLMATQTSTSTSPEASHCFQMAGWCLFAMMAIVAMVLAYRNQQHQSKISKQRLLLMVLALRVTEYAEAFETTWREKQEQQEQQRELSEQLESLGAALESANAILFDPENPESLSWEGLASACEETMQQRMEMPFPQWVKWTAAGNNAVFALRTWGGLVWRFLDRAIIEVIACGSCGGGLGKRLMKDMLGRVTKSVGVFYFVLKALTGSENFWGSQDFELLGHEPDVSWWPSCPEPVRRALQRYRTASSGLPTYVRRFESVRGVLPEGMA
ncbi:unnamed protein product [Symbiodinium sp. CCMP2592]|nr:unnamed protein product [Symbiodinium sp. CCMP2592]